MIRLDINDTTAAFQFLIGAIKVVTKAYYSAAYVHFNSLLVRLKLIQ